VGWLHGEGYIASLRRSGPVAAERRSGVLGRVKRRRLAQVKGERRKTCVLASGCGAGGKTMIADPEASSNSAPMRGDHQPPNMRTLFKQLFLRPANAYKRDGLHYAPRHDKRRCFSRRGHLPAQASTK